MAVVISVPHTKELIPHWLILMSKSKMLLRLRENLLVALTSDVPFGWQWQGRNLMNW